MTVADPAQAPASEPAQTLGELLLVLYQAAQQQPVEDFRRQALEAIGRCIPYDGAHWSLVAGREIHGASLIGLPEHCAEWFNESREHDAVARACAAQPGRALCFGPDELGGTAQGLALARSIGAQQVMVTTGAEASTANMVGLVRGRGAVPFTPAEQALLQWLTPHLSVLLDANACAAPMRSRADAVARLAQLTPRERDVASAYAQGHSHKAVAARLGVSPATVRGYLRQVYDKLALHDKAQLARLLAQAEPR